MVLWEQYLKVFKINHHIIKYEDIVLNFEKSVQKVLDFLELPWSNDVLEFYKKAQSRKRISSSSYDQVIKPIYSESINNWKKYQKEISEIIPLLKYWTDKFNWKGRGKVPAEELITLNKIIFDVHSEGKKLRFWGSPDNEQTWQILFSSGVDLINTDKILKLYKFMKKINVLNSIKPRK